MQTFNRLTSRMIPLPLDDVDTDQIIPARYLKTIGKDGLREGLFASWRYQEDGSPIPEFPLNQPVYRDCQILLAGHNFGCGSSREHAPWALLDWGIRAVVSTSFADIFRNNALKNGLLPVEVDAQTHRHLLDLTARAKQDGQNGSVMEVRIDLESQSIRLPGGHSASFPIDPFSKTCLLEGLEPLDYLLRLEEHISAFEKSLPSYPTGGQQR
jgi:3-isopropylmalate/(R)-2-methylmalate dehydratase small subunit